MRDQRVALPCQPPGPSRLPLAPQACDRMACRPLRGPQEPPDSVREAERCGRRAAPMRHAHPRPRVVRAGGQRLEHDGAIGGLQLWALPHKALPSGGVDRTRHGAVLATGRPCADRCAATPRQASPLDRQPAQAPFILAPAASRTRGRSGRHGLALGAWVRPPRGQRRLTCRHGLGVVFSALVGAPAVAPAGCRGRADAPCSRRAAHHMPVAARAQAPCHGPSLGAGRGAPVGLAAWPRRAAAVCQAPWQSAAAGGGRHAPRRRARGRRDPDGPPAAAPPGGECGLGGAGGGRGLARAGGAGHLARQGGAVSAPPPCRGAGASALSGRSPPAKEDISTRGPRGSSS